VFLCSFSPLLFFRRSRNRGLIMINGSYQMAIHPRVRRYSIHLPVSSSHGSSTVFVSPLRTCKP
jgi:hypothetical protein